MSVDGSVASRAREVFILPVGDVLVCSGITVLLGQAKVNDVDQVALFTETHQKIVRLHISVDEVLGVDVFNSTDLEKISFNKIHHWSTSDRMQNLIFHPECASTQKRFFSGSSHRAN